MLFIKWMIKVFVGLSMAMSLTVACSPVNFEKSTNGCGGLGEGSCVVRPTDPTYIDYSYVYTASTPKVDILIVNDSSRSMEKDQQNMSSNFGSFLSEISNLDWRLGITTMDISDNYRDLSNDTDVANPASWTIPEYSYLRDYQDGNLIPLANGKKILSRSDSNALSVFNDGIEIKDGYFAKSGDERGIYSAALSIQNNKNSLIRNGAHLAIIFLSDEDVRGKGRRNTESRKMPKSYDESSHLRSVINSELGSTKPVSVYPIVVPSSDSTNCLRIQRDQLGYYSSAAEGLMYEELLSDFQGAVGNICANNYATLLRSIGQDIDQRTKEVITLACEPNTENGNVFDVIGLPNSYSVDLDGKEVTIKPALSPGQSVTFKYSCI